MTHKTPAEGSTKSLETSRAFAGFSARQFLSLALVAGVAGSLLTSGVGLLMGARNSSGTYSLPSGNPVVTGTTITSSWANNTLSDISTEITNSLDRSGRGGMTGPLELSNGSVSAPSLSWVSEPSTGPYRIGSHDIGFAINGAKTTEWTANTTTITGAATSNAPALQAFEPSMATGQYTQIQVGTAATNNNATVLQYLSNATAANSRGCIDVYGQGQTLCVDGNAKVYVGATGTGITGSFGATYNLTAGVITAGTCYTSGNQTLTGVAVGGVCNVSSDAELGGGSHIAITPYCAVTAPNVVQVYVCNGSSGSFTSGAGNYRVRVWQP